MKGLISAYQLSGKTGSRIGKIKSYDAAWSHPAFLPNFFSNPGPLFIYDKIYIDEASYKSLYLKLDDENRKIVKTYVESSKLNIFEFIEAEKLIKKDLDNTINKLRTDFDELYNDSEFNKIVETIMSLWGNDYANPSPNKFEAMNIPLTEILREKLSKEKQSDLSIIDYREKILLYKVSGFKKFSKKIIPEASKILVELVPKYFGLVPKVDTWNIDTIRRIRENEHIKKYHKKVKRVAKRASKEFENVINPDKNDYLYNFDLSLKDRKELIKELELILNTIQYEALSELEDIEEELWNEAKIQVWEILGYIAGGIGIAGQLVPEIKDITLKFGIPGGVISAINCIKRIRKSRERKKLEWTRFIKYIGEEIQN